MTLWWTMQCCLFICVQYIYTDGGQPDTVVDIAMLFIYMYVYDTCTMNGGQPDTVVDNAMLFIYTYVYDTCTVNGGQPDAAVDNAMLFIYMCTILVQ